MEHICKYQRTVKLKVWLWQPSILALIAEAEVYTTKQEVVLAACSNLLVIADTDDRP